MLCFAHIVREPNQPKSERNSGTCFNDRNMVSDMHSRIEHSRHIHVVGSSGSGKSSLARKLATEKNLGYLELDDINHLPGWTERSNESFRSELTRRLDEADGRYGGWVLDGNYFSRAEDIYRDRVDCVVWLDYPQRLIMRRLLLRSLRRVVLRQTLWNGNRERIRSLLSLDPSKSILMWSRTHHETLSARYEKFAAADARWLRVRSPHEAATLFL